MRREIYMFEGEEMEKTVLRRLRCRRQKFPISKS